MNRNITWAVAYQAQRDVVDDTGFGSRQFIYIKTVYLSEWVYQRSYKVFPCLCRTDWEWRRKHVQWRMSSTPSFTRCLFYCLGETTVWLFSPTVDEPKRLFSPTVAITHTKHWSCYVDLVSFQTSPSSNRFLRTLCELWVAKFSNQKHVDF